MVYQMKKFVSMKEMRETTKFGLEEGFEGKFPCHSRRSPSRSMFPLNVYAMKDII
jgi:hypothetical protein